MERRLAGIAGLQRENDVMEIAFFARRPSDVLNFELRKQLLEYLATEKANKLRLIQETQAGDSP